MTIQIKSKTYSLINWASVMCLLLVFSSLKSQDGNLKPRDIENGITIMFPNNIEEEPHGCGTLPPTDEQREQSLKDRANYKFEKNAGTNCIAIMPHIFRMDDGSGGLTNEQLAKGLTFLNNFYYDAGLEFYYCGVNYINNSDLYEFNDNSPDNDTETDLVNATTPAGDAVNVFFVNSITLGMFGACGYARFPFDSPVSNRVVMDIGCMFWPNGTYVHEFGHYFNLYHTHQGTENGNAHADAENVPRTGGNANCSTKGDQLCDTEADPRYDSTHFDFGTCMDTGGEMDINGEPYTPPVENVMSYYPDGCGGLFTPEQYTRILGGYTSRMGHTSYSLDCTPPTVSVPTNLSATFVTNKIDLSWTDNAANELGYMIERSTTSGSTGFMALVNGGTANNVTTYSDTDVLVNTTYWYRIKPINGDCNTYSTSASATTGFFYCEANSMMCDEFISRVQIGTIDNTSGCTSGGYHDYTSLSTDVTIGVGIPFTITNGNLLYPADECGIWVDWNNNGDFYDMGEAIIVTGSPGIGPYTGTITPPANATAGDHRMRIRIVWNRTPASCGTQEYGEVEDYILHIDNCVGNMTRTWTGSYDNNWLDAANWDCGVPDNSHHVIIPVGTPDAILSFGQTGYCYTIEVEEGAVLTVVDGAELNVEEP